MPTATRFGHTSRRCALSPNLPRRSLGPVAPSLPGERAPSLFPTPFGASVASADRDFCLRAAPAAKCNCHPSIVGSPGNSDLLRDTVLTSWSLALVIDRVDYHILSKGRFRRYSEFRHVARHCIAARLSANSTRSRWISVCHTPGEGSNVSAHLAFRRPPPGTRVPVRPLRCLLPRYALHNWSPAGPQSRSAGEDLLSSRSKSSSHAHTGHAPMRIDRCRSRRPWLDHAAEVSKIVESMLNSHRSRVDFVPSSCRIRMNFVASSCRARVELVSNASRSRAEFVPTSCRVSVVSNQSQIRVDSVSRRC